MERFLERNREVILRRWLAKLPAQLPAERSLTETELVDSFHLYLDEVVDALRSARGGRALASGKSVVARMHGSQRHALQRSLEDLVKEYGILFESVVETATEVGETLAADDLVALSNRLSSGCAEAAAQYAVRRDEELQRAQFEHFAFLAHELRNPLSSAAMAWRLVRDGCDPRNGALLERNLRRVQALIDQSLVEVRLRSIGVGVPLQVERAPVVDLVREICADCEADAAAKQVSVTIDCESGLTIDVDLRLFRSALSNLVRNAIKFTPVGAGVSVTSRSEGDRVFVEVEDTCGGLPAGRAERLFEAFTQAGGNRSGFGLGLAIARQAVEAHHGAISVKSIDGKGCVFIIDVARST